MLPDAAIIDDAAIKAAHHKMGNGAASLQRIHIGHSITLRSGSFQNVALAHCSPQILKRGDPPALIRLDPSSQRREQSRRCCADSASASDCRGAFRPSTGPGSEAWRPLYSTDPPPIIAAPPSRDPSTGGTSRSLPAAASDERNRRQGLPPRQ